MMKRFLVFSLFLLQSILLFSQGTGKIRVFAMPDTAIIKIDSLKLEFGKFIELDTGTYQIRAWAPFTELVTKEINLKAKSLKTVRIKLPYTKDYRSYKRKKRQYRFNKQALRYGLLIGFGITTFNGLQNIKTYGEDANRFKSEADYFKDRYNQSFWAEDITFNRLRFNQSQLNYNEAVNEINRNWLIIQASAGIAIVGSYFGWKLSNRLKKPSFKEEPKLSQFYISPILIPYSTGILINYQF